MSDSTRDTLTELGERARVIVEQLARKAAERREKGAAEAAPESPGDSAGHSMLAGLGQRLGELRACVGEVADVLEATVERLETVEHQLGDPDESLERELRDGLERCERVLMGIELRVERVSAAAAPPMTASAPPLDVDESLAVLVVAPSSGRRTRLCLALERQGVRALAACDLAVALAVTARSRPRLAVLDLADWGGDAADFLDEWMEYQEHGSLPRAAVLDPVPEHPGARGFAPIRSEFGDAATAASLVRLAAQETSKQEQEG